MDWTTIGGIAARHGLTVIGGALAHDGILPDGVTPESFVGAGMVLAGVVWSWWQKQGHAAALAAEKTAADYWLAAEKTAADYWRNKKTAPRAHP